MPMKKHPHPHPYRTGYRSELEYPKKGSSVLPSHGSGPRCRVDYNPNDEGPWAMLHIMRIENFDMAVEPEQFTCVMPRYYAIPLMLVNKRLAFAEAQCRPDGTALAPPAPDSEDSSEEEDSSTGGKRKKSVGALAHELCEYTYLWRLRARFLQAVFEMNYVRVLDEQWRHVGLHGFLHRMYGRYGHDRLQRLAYWRDQIQEGRTPYSKPDIAEMDWAAYLREETAETSTRTRIDGFLWGHMSQGYSRVVQDKPPHESWRAWRKGGGGRRRRRGARHQGDDASQLPALYRTPGPAREMPHGPRTEQSPEGSDTRQDVEEDEVGAAAPWAAAAAAAEEGAFSSGSSGDVAAGGQRSGAVDADEDVLRAALVGPPHSQEWALPFPRAERSSQSSSPGTSSDQAQAAGTRSSSPGRLRPIQISFRMNAPENLELTDIQCTFTPVEDMREGFPGTTLRVAYASKIS
ncbi:hypothetical protein BC826DRAFT_988386 [Russula brevipes]|nr:hypothetical protein BC826DRAFT_988386 [Russula brevipes]